MKKISELESLDLSGRNKCNVVSIEMLKKDALQDIKEKRAEIKELRVRQMDDKILANNLEIRIMMKQGVINYLIFKFDIKPNEQDEVKD